MRLVVTDAAGRILTRASARPATTNAWHTISISTRSLAPGVYRVALRAVDRAGNFQRGLTAVRLTVWRLRSPVRAASGRLGPA